MRVTIQKPFGCQFGEPHQDMKDDLAAFTANDTGMQALAKAIGRAFLLEREFRREGKTALANGQNQQILYLVRKRKEKLLEILLKNTTVH